MKAFLTVTLLWIVLCSINIVLGKQDDVPGRNTRYTLLQKVLQSLDRILVFFDAEFEEVNLDAIFGLRIVEGVLESILNTSNRSWRNYPTNLRNNLTSLKKRVTYIIEKSLPYLKTSDDEYFQQVGIVVKKRWKVVKEFKALHPEGTARVSDEEVKSKVGQAHQSCMVALFGSGGPGSKPCNVTGRCWQVMTRLDNVGYTLTHQALYFMFAEQRGCSSVFAAKLNESNIHGGIPTMYRAICTTIYHQMLILENVQKTQTQQMDLYLEQSVVCGLLGYTEFLSIFRLDRLLRLQMPGGCYGDPLYDAQEGEIMSRFGNISLLN